MNPTGSRAKQQPQPRSNNEIRRLILQYFYLRNKNATSIMGTRGSAIKISDAKRELKDGSNLTQQEKWPRFFAQSNGLRYVRTPLS